jgi:hypothetical protein
MLVVEQGVEIQPEAQAVLAAVEMGVKQVLLELRVLLTLGAVLVEVLTTVVMAQTAVQAL